ncbi:MAG: GGDEF domain-containing protein [Oscillospiraceae bacterium]|nr:GGDEF domain-containing protein [Oscillospiraceae bacterium]
MKDRKRIAVVAANVRYEGYQHPVLKGILTQAAALDYDTAIFSPFICYENDTPYQRGEDRIYDLIDYSFFDAVIYIPCSIINNPLRAKLEKDFEENCPVPVIALEHDNPALHCIQTGDRAAFEQMVTHLIETHGLTRIMCLTGFEGNLQAELRLQGYRDAMERHGLPIPEDYVIYGDFWKMAATELAEKIADGRAPRPQAVVCCCDTVAITLCNRLVELGFRVPEDIVVTGYDASKEAEENVPSITSYDRPLVGLGVDAVLEAHRLITGETAAPAVRDVGRLIPAESCGCGEDFRQKFEKRQSQIRNTETYRELFENCPMTETLNSTETLNDLLLKLIEHLYLINGANDWYLCMCDAWDDPAKNTGAPSAYNNYTDRMHLRIDSTDRDSFVVDVPFDRRDLLPAFHTDREHPRAFYITPLHFNERCFGYTALSFGDEPMAFDVIYHSWIRNLTNALEFMRVRNILSSMNQRLFTASIRDALTGIFNRKGFKHYSEELFRKAAETDKKLLIIAADLDDLKVINDTYGHVEGDNAISVAANALGTCVARGEICARTGGDEFLIIGCADYTEETPSQYLSYIYDFLEQYNNATEKPYTVGMSLGWVIAQVHAGEDLQTYIDEADARMYENKVARKKGRR